MRLLAQAPLYSLLSINGFVSSQILAGIFNQLSNAATTPAASSSTTKVISTSTSSLAPTATNVASNVVNQVVTAATSGSNKALASGSIPQGTCNVGQFTITPNKLGGVLGQTTFQVSITPSSNTYYTKNALDGKWNVGCWKLSNFTSPYTQAQFSASVASGNAFILNSTSKGGGSFTIPSTGWICYLWFNAACGTPQSATWYNSAYVGLSTFILDSGNWTSPVTSAAQLAQSVASSVAALNNTQTSTSNRAALAADLATNIGALAVTSASNATSKASVLKSRDSLMASISNIVTTSSASDAVTNANALVGAVANLITPSLAPDASSASLAGSIISSVLNSVISQNGSSTFPYSTASNVLTTMGSILTTSGSSASNYVSASLNALSLIAAQSAASTGGSTSFTDPAGTITIVGTASVPSSVANIAVTNSTFVAGNAFSGYLTGLSGTYDVSQVLSRAIAIQSNPYAGVSPDSANVTRTSIFQYSIFDATGTNQIPVSGLSTPFSIGFNIASNPIFAGAQIVPVCQYWNTTLNTWATDGCTYDTVNSNSTYGYCLCTHLTAFSVSLSNIAPNAINVVANAASAQHTTLIYMIAVIFCAIWIVLVIYTWHSNRMNDFANADSNIADYALYTVSIQTGNAPMDGTTARTYVTIMGDNGATTTKMLFKHVIAAGSIVSKDLIAFNVGAPTAISVSHDATGPRIRWKPVNAMVVNRTNGYTAQFDVDADIVETGTATCQANKMVSREPGIAARIASNFSVNLRDRHIWVSTVTAPLTSAFSHTERVATCFLILFGNMGLGFYWHRSNGVTVTFTETVLVALITSGILLTVTTMIIWILRNAKPYTMQSIYTEYGENSANGKNQKSTETAYKLSITWRYAAWVLMVFATLGGLVLAILAATYLDATNSSALSPALQSFMLSFLESLFLSSNVMVSLRSIWQAFNPNPVALNNSQDLDYEGSLGPLNGKNRTTSGSSLPAYSIQASHRIDTTESVGELLAFPASNGKMSERPATASRVPSRTPSQYETEDMPQYYPPAAISPSRSTTSLSRQTSSRVVKGSYY